ncbi:MAG: NAD-binding protein [Microthrixaceae bacterium]
MHVIVLGAGEVGSYVAERLSNQGGWSGHRERSGPALRGGGEADVYVAVLGSARILGCSPAASACELLVAVTNHDEANPRGIAGGEAAGVAWPDLVRPTGPGATGGLAARGTSVPTFVIDPDQEAARDILQLLDAGAVPGGGAGPGRGADRAPGFHLESSLVGKTSPRGGDRERADWEFLFGTISRGGETIIPRGNHELRADDMVRVLCKRAARRRLMDVLDLEARAPRSVLLLGGGRTAELVALPLARRGAEVVIVERDEGRARELAESLHRVTVLQGDITDAEVLLDADVGKFDAVAALTGADDANIIACLFANSQGVGETLAIAHRLELLPMLTEIGIDAALSPRTATADRVISLVRGEIAGVATFLEGPVEILEYEVAPGSAADGSIVADMDLPEDLLLGAVVHEGVSEIARGRSKLAAGDHVVAFAMPSAAERVGRLFA